MQKHIYCKYICFMAMCRIPLVPAGCWCALVTSGVICGWTATADQPNCFIVHMSSSKQILQVGKRLVTELVTQLSSFSKEFACLATTTTSPKRQPPKNSETYWDLLKRHSVFPTFCKVTIDFNSHVAREAVITIRHPNLKLVKPQRGINYKYAYVSSRVCVHSIDTLLGTAGQPPSTSLNGLRLRSCDGHLWLWLLLVREIRCLHHLAADPWSMALGAGDLFGKSCKWPPGFFSFFGWFSRKNEEKRSFLGILFGS